MFSDDMVSFVLAVPHLYRDDDIWCKIVKECFPNLRKNDFQSWKNFYFFLKRCVNLLKIDYNYTYSGLETECPSETYNRLRYNSHYYEKKFSDYLAYTCQQNTC